MTKMDRQKVFDKFGGRCAYCGCSLNKRWHADHVEAIWRKSKMVGGYYINKETRQEVRWRDIYEDSEDKFEWVERRTVPDGCGKPELDIIENMLPSCASCNILKGANNIEQFRFSIQRFINSLNNYTNQYKIAKKYGLVQETGIEVKFYFETINQQP